MSPRLPTACPKPKRRQKKAKQQLPRSTKPIPRSTKPIRAKKRTPAEDARIYGPQAFRTWLHEQPCLICLAHPRYTEQAHARGDGTARKASWRESFPACGPRPLKDHPGMTEGCHRRVHRVGVKTFEAAMGFTLESLAKETQARWLASGLAQPDETRV